MVEWRQDDDLDENEDPDESDQDGDEDSSDISPCPRCGREIYEDAERCPYCGHYVTMDTIRHGKAWWFVLAAVLALLAVIAWVILTS